VPVLEHLTDITVEPNTEAGTGFKLHFHFSENEYFSNTVSPVRLRLILLFYMITESLFELC
jgi:hypothetical protein